MHAFFDKFVWENKTGTIATFYFRPEREYRFTAGQYADITIPHTNADSRGITCTMTFSTCPGEALLGFTTRMATNGPSTYKQALLKLKAGDVVSVTDAMGDMILPADARIPLVFVAGGVGIASYASIIKHLYYSKESRSITLLHACRSEDDMIFAEIFESYASVAPLAWHIYSSSLPTTATSVEGGSRISGASTHSKRLNSKDIFEYTGIGSQIFLSGSEGMVEQFRDELTSKFSIEQYRIAFDYFSGYSPEQL